MKETNFTSTDKEAAPSGVRRLSSIRLKVVGVLLASINITIILCICVIIPNVRENLIHTTQSYMYDLTNSYGKVLSQNVGISVMYLRTDRLENLVGDTGLQNVSTSHFFVTDEKGMILYHPDNTLIGSTVEDSPILELTGQIADGQIPDPDVVRYEKNGENIYSSYYIVADGKAILVLSAEEKDIFKPITDITRQAIIFCIILSVVLGFSSFLMIDRLTKPIITISKIVGKFAKMDLTPDPRLNKISRRKDETGTIGVALLSLREALAGIISDIQQQSTLLYHTAESLSSNAAATSGTVQNVERAVSDIAANATSQAEETQKATDDILLIGNMVENTSSEVSSLRTIAQSIKSSSDHANSTLQELDSINQRAIDSINTIYEQTHTTNESALKA